MKKSKTLSLLLIILTLFSTCVVVSSALTWDGDSGGGNTSAVNGSSTGYVIRSTSDSACVVGYRFSAVDSAGNLKNNKVIDIYRNTANGNNAYFTSAKFSVKMNKKQLIAQKNSTLYTTYNTVNCYKESGMGFLSVLPNPSGMATWQAYETNINKALIKLGISSTASLIYGDKVIVEPLFDVCLAGEYQALTVTEIAYCGRSVLGGSSNGGTSNGTSNTWGFIANYTNRIWPNKLYTPNGQGLWTAATEISGTNKETFDTLLSTGYGAGIAYNENRAPVLTLVYDCYGSSVRIADSSKGFTLGAYNRICTKKGTNKTVAGTANVYYHTLTYDNALGSGGLCDFSSFGLVAPTGYKFKAWHGAKGDFNEATAYKASQLSDSIKNGDTYIWLSAKFSPINYTVRYYLDGVEQTALAQTCAYGTSYKYPTLPAKTGYAVNGWWSGSSASSKGTQYSVGGSFSNLSATDSATVRRYAYSVKTNPTVTAHMYLNGLPWDNKNPDAPESYGKITGHHGTIVYSKGEGAYDCRLYKTSTTISSNTGGYITLKQKGTSDYIYEATNVTPGTYYLAIPNNRAHYVWNGGSAAKAKVVVDANKTIICNYYTVKGWAGTGILRVGSTPSVPAENLRGATSDYKGISDMVGVWGYGVEGSVVTLNAVVNPSDYVFDKWQRIDGGGTFSTTNTSFSLTINGELEYRAIGKLKTYLVSYNANGGVNAPAAQSKQRGIALTLTSSIPTRTGYSFVNWTEWSWGGDAKYSPGGKYTSDKDITLYAQWTPAKYNITYNANGGSGAPGTQTKTHGTNLTLSAVKPTRTGYTFSQWNTKSDGSGTNYSPSSVYSANAAMTLYARWTPVTYTITYNANGGSEAPATQKKTHDVDLTLTTAKPTRAGYIFKNWNTVSTGTGTAYSPSGKYTSNANATLYAQWEATHLLSLTAITPNAPYRENTDVITSFNLVNSGASDCTPSDNVSVVFNVYKDATCIKTVTITNAVVPHNDKNLLFFKWTVPANLNSCNIVITGTILESGVQYPTIRKTYASCKYTISATPDTQYEISAPSGFVKPLAPSVNEGTATWDVWSYSNGAFKKTSYGIGMTKYALYAEPTASSNAAFTNGQWIMKSGYGIEASVNTGAGGLSGYTLPSSASYTLAQYATATFPEFSYLTEPNKFKTLELVSGKWVFRQNGNYGRIHFTPLWYLDGTYSICITQSDMWTPAGMITRKVNTQAIIISGSAYDDWYIN